MAGFFGDRKMQIVLDKAVYYPGQTINGRVVCNFTSDTKVRAIRIRFDGAANVHFHGGGKMVLRADEKYFNLEANILSRKTVIPPGQHAYPFTFDLPIATPPSVKQLFGDVNYTIQATVDRPWSIDYVDEIKLKICTYTDLNYVDGVKDLKEFTERKKPTSFSDTGYITLNVRLPKTGYVPSEMVAFASQVINHSNINVQEVIFKLVQVFTFEAVSKSKGHAEVLGDIFAVVDSLVAPGLQKSWNLELRLPADVFTGNMVACRIMNSYLQLRGEVILPFPHDNFEIIVPLVLGDVPVANPY